MTLLYTVPHQEAFGVPIVIDFFLTGLAAGVFIISTLGYCFGLTKFKSLGKPGVVIALLAVAGAPLCLLYDTGRPLRAWHLFLYLHGTSPISWGSLFLTIFPIDCILYGFFMFRGNDRLTRFFGFVGIPLALSVHGYTGFILSFAKAHALWRSSMMPVLFLTAAMASGVALMMLVAIVKDALFSEAGKVDTDLLSTLGNLLLWFLVFDLFLSFSDLGIHYFGEGEAMETAHLLLAGAFAPLFLGVETLLGKVVPLILVSTNRSRSAAIYGFASVLVLIGIFTMRYNIVLGGQYIPLL